MEKTSTEGRGYIRRTDAKYLSIPQAMERYQMGRVLLKKIATEKNALLKFGAVYRIDIDKFEA